jgi:serine/threonine protein kinase
VDDRINFLSEMYNYAKKHPGLVQVKELPKIKDRITYRVILETRGQDCRFTNEDEVREMARSVLTGLTWLHQGGYVHRDIRLPNILYLPDANDFKYILIDLNIVVLVD